MSDLLYIVSTKIAPEVEEEFNVWQETEHGPYLLQLPGYQSVIRYKDMDIPYRYANFWHISAMKDFENPERLRRANTPWGKYLSPFRDRRIDFYVQDGGIDQDAPQAELDPRFSILFILAYSTDDDKRLEITHFYRNNLPLLKEITGVLDIRIYHANQNKAIEENYIFYYLAGNEEYLVKKTIPVLKATKMGVQFPVRCKIYRCISQNSVKSKLEDK